MLGPSGDVPIWQGFKDLNTSFSLSFSTAKRKYFILAYLKLWPTLNTHCPSSVQSQSDGEHKSKVVGQEKWHPPHRSCTVSLSGVLLEGNFPLLTPTRTFIWSDSSVRVNDSCCPSTNDTLTESQQCSYRTSQSKWQSCRASVLSISVNTN